MQRHVKESSQQERRVYVGNLAYEVRWHHLKEFMRQAGEVLFADVLTLPGGRSKGCGIVEYATREEAEKAVDTLSNQMLMGRLVYVREDRETEPKFNEPRGPPPPGRERERDRDRERAPLSSGGPPVGDVKPGCQLFIGNLPFSTGWQELKDLFRGAGKIVRADVNIGRDGRSRGTGIVLFDNEDDARNAIERFNGFDLNGRQIEVREDRFAGSSGLPPRDSRPPRSPRPAAPRNEFTDWAAGNGEPSETIFVGNLPWSTTNQDLVELFETVGNVERAEIKFLPSGRSAGSGVVKFDTPASAEIAISKFNGYSYGNRDLGLSYIAYRPREHHRDHHHNGPPPHSTSSAGPVDETIQTGAMDVDYTS